MTIPAEMPRFHTSMASLEKKAEQFRLKHLQGNAPFTGTDVSAGVENEFQVAVQGKRDDVDLPLVIEQSNYFQDLLLQAQRGDISQSSIDDIHSYLREQENQVWENSWVRFPRSVLGAYADSVLNHDLLADKAYLRGPVRKDIDRFLFRMEGQPWIRVPVSYLLKLSLAKAIAPEGFPFPDLVETGRHMMRHFISDNISPEITSFSLAHGKDNQLPGQATAKETSSRYFFIQLLVQYANRSFSLEKHGQRCHLYFGPQPPTRQKELNNLLSDGFYRDLFLNPCLSGWQKGEEKRRYMELCHRILSQSQLNTIARLREAGIIVNNLIVLPNTSSTCLANNGTHVSLSSRFLSDCFQQESSLSVNQYEKYFGDLIIKAVEHFLPLFVGTISAAPYRWGFSDFHPEKVLGFLPHELENTHLRMIWRRWKKKAHLRFMGRIFTPVGPRWVDSLLSKSFRLKGDYVPDARLVDYLVALKSVRQHPALNGRLNNQDLLKKDLLERGVYDPRMSMYLPYKLRELDNIGFSGFEGRYYSLFPNLHGFMALGVDLQTLITAYASFQVMHGHVRHAHIPDDPFTESERRQIFFDAAIGIPTFYVRKNTSNRFLKNILSHVSRQRESRRYRGYLRIEVQAYQLACLEMMLADEVWLQTLPEAKEVLLKMQAMVSGREPNAAHTLTSALLREHMGRKKPRHHLDIDSSSFNSAAEVYYRNALRTVHMQEGLTAFVEESRQVEKKLSREKLAFIHRVTGGQSVPQWIEQTGKRCLDRQATTREIHHLLLLFVLLCHQREHGHA